MNILNEAAFEGIHNGKKTSLHTLKNNNGLVAQITNYGAIIVSLYVPDRNGNLADVVQGYESIKEYINGNGPFMGAVCGRCANRIGKGKFTLEGKNYSLAVNNGPNHLHGGNKGFDKVVWDVIKAGSDSVELRYLAKDGEEGYPGNLEARVKYTLTSENELKLVFTAKTDKTTLANFAGHTYFNLAGAGSGSIYDHELMINALYFTPTDDSNIPTGEILNVSGTPFDFTKPSRIGKNIDVDNEQLKFGAGYDHNWIINKLSGKLDIAAIAYDHSSGRQLEVLTTQPGVQFYSGNWLNNEKGKYGKVYNRRWGFCLETQHFPDSVNKLHFPSPILNPGDEYKHTCIYKFSAR